MTSHGRGRTEEDTGKWYRNFAETTLPVRRQEELDLGRCAVSGPNTKQRTRGEQLGKGKGIEMWLATAAAYLKTTRI
jgi:hypothetical protein